MIEIAIGLLTLLAAAAAALGLGEGRLPIPIDLLMAGFLAALGLLLAAHGFYRVKLKRGTSDRHWVRSTGLMWLMVTFVLVFSILVPLVAPLLNAFRVAGFPLGYYMVAQGSLIVLVMAAFVFAARADGIDEQEGAGED
jgi:putative solute:sodium symporter small subunit